MTNEYIADAEQKNRIFAERFASFRAVSKWETGRGTPKFSDTPILASIFGVTTDYLFGCDRK